MSAGGSGAPGGHPDVLQPPASTGDIIKLPNLTDKDLQDIDDEMRNKDTPPGAVTTYAAAAKKTRRDFPWVLYITVGDPAAAAAPGAVPVAPAAPAVTTAAPASTAAAKPARKHLSKAHWDALEEAMFKARLDMSEEDHDLIDIAWKTFRGTYGIVACEDRHTQQWLRSLATHLQFEGVQTLTSAHWVREEAWECRGFLTGSRWKTQSRIQFYGAA